MAGFPFLFLGQTESVKDCDWKITVILKEAPGTTVFTLQGHGAD
jgi:hypothetical protein